MQVEVSQATKEGEFRLELGDGVEWRLEGGEVDDLVVCEFL